MASFKTFLDFSYSENSIVGTTKGLCRNQGYSINQGSGACQGEVTAGRKTKFCIQVIYFWKVFVVQKLKFFEK